MRELRGKVAVVTGAASGIGRALAMRFAREGMHLVLADIEPVPLEEVREEIAASGAEAIAIATDVSDGTQLEALARRAFDVYGAAHVVCNNAGVAVGGMAWELTDADWQWVLGVNLWGVIHGIRAFVPRMIAQGEGHLVNTASIAGLIAAPVSAPYCATKHAVVALSECLHHDLAMANAGAVKVSVLCPSWVKTRIADAARNRPASGVQAPRPARPHEAALEAMVRSAVAGGIDPMEVADHVVSAIHEERFWVLTHPSSKQAVERRARGIAEDRLPEIQVPK